MLPKTFVRKGDNAGNQHCLLSHNVFHHFKDRNTLLSKLTLSSADVFILEVSTFVSLRRVDDNPWFSHKLEKDN